MIDARDAVTHDTFSNIYNSNEAASLLIFQT